MALKTNNKIVKAFFDNYLKNILSDNFDNKIENLQAQFVASATDASGRLYSVYCNKYQNYQDAFKEISFNYGDCYYDDMRETLKKALNETDAESMKYDNERVSNLYNYLLFSAYNRALDNAGLKINNGFNHRY